MKIRGRRFPITLHRSPILHHDLDAHAGCWKVGDKASYAAVSLA